jgi:anthranilate phosphoribosyltransferase
MLNPPCLYRYPVLSNTAKLLCCLQSVDRWTQGLVAAPLVFSGLAAAPLENSNSYLRKLSQHRPTARVSILDPVLSNTAKLLCCLQSVDRWTQGLMAAPLVFSGLAAAPLENSNSYLRKLGQHRPTARVSILDSLGDLALHAQTPNHLSS